MASVGGAPIYWGTAYANNATDNLEFVAANKPITVQSTAA